MRILAAEPDWTRLAALTALLRRVCPTGELHTFLSPQALEAWLDRHGPAADAVFLPADGPGLALARTLHRRRPRTNLIFMASDPDAFRAGLPPPRQRLPAPPGLGRAGGRRAVRPALPPGGDARKASGPDLRQLRRLLPGPARPLPPHPHAGAVRLPHRPPGGAGSTMGELVSILWEGRPDTPGVRSQLRSLIADLRTTLAALDQSAVIRKQRDLIAVDPERVDCDYYHYLDGEEGAFRGEYMSNYSWAEMTLGGLE